MTVMTTAEINNIKKNIVQVLKKHSHVSPSRGRKLLRFSDMVGKLYEAKVLAEIIENLVTKEGLQVSLQGSGNLVFKAKGGPVNRSFPYFKVWRDGQLFAELFNDVYFNTISSVSRGNRGNLKGDYHELDIALLQPGVSNKPKPDEIYLAVECKNTGLSKKMIRELLGFRRELSYFQYFEKTKFNNWPEDYVNAKPASVHMLYISRNKHLNDYRKNCGIFGILLEYYPM